MVDLCLSQAFKVSIAFVWYASRTVILQLTFQQPSSIFKLQPMLSLTEIQATFSYQTV